VPKITRKQQLTIIGRNIRYARLKADLTQRELGAKIDVDPNLISKWERGLHYPLVYIHKIARNLHVPMEWLYKPHPKEWAAMRDWKVRREIPFASGRAAMADEESLRAAEEEEEEQAQEEEDPLAEFDPGPPAPFENAA
jgi:transcriptional regulator with XRE-family HTH domain